MKKFLLMLKKCKKGFTLMECVCAIAVVGIISAMLLPLTAGAIRSFRATQSLRETAAAASAKNATKKTDGTNNKQKKLYVTVSYSIYPRMEAESSFVFSESTSSDSDYNVSVTYYDLKYGFETKD